MNRAAKTAKPEHASRQSSSDVNFAQAVLNARKELFGANSGGFKDQRKTLDEH
jgi:hypothetical protein